MSDRAVSEVLGYALVFSLVIVMVSIISVSGLSGYQNVQTFERESNAQKAFDVMHNNVEDVYFKGAPSRATEIDLGETSISLGETVRINVTVNGTEEANVTTRPIVQDLGEENQLVYEGGAVFQTGRDGGIVRREPPMMQRSDRGHVVIPNLTQGGRRGIGGGIVRIRTRSIQQGLLYENNSGDLSVNVSVRSPRSGLWREYLDDQPEFDCTDSGNLVRCEATLDRFYVVRSDLGVYFDR